MRWGAFCFETGQLPSTLVDVVPGLFQHISMAAKELNVVRAKALDCHNSTNISTMDLQRESTTATEAENVPILVNIVFIFPSVPIILTIYKRTSNTRKMGVLTTSDVDQQTRDVRWFPPVTSPRREFGRRLW